jgi:phosphodiesterase/alkaline phosphatase D-like protein
MLDMRTYKDPNGANTYADPTRGLLGAQQRRWLIEGLRRSKAAWKVIANDLPLGLVVPDGPTAQEGVAQGDNGAPLGRELEFAQVLRDAHVDGVTGIVLLTADVHYTAAHRYDPARATVGDFTPFWEFVSGPANAGAFGPNALDGTFGPASGVRACAARAQHLATGRLPAFRRGGYRRREQGPDGTAARPRRRAALVDDAARLTPGCAGRVPLGRGAATAAGRRVLRLFAGPLARRS